MRNICGDIRVLTHASIRLVLRDAEKKPVVIYCDPYRMDRAPADADLLLITHAHYDHYAPEDIAAVRKEHTEVIYPASMRGETAASGIAPSAEHFLAWEECLDFRGIRITAIPAYNPKKQFHPKERQWIGFLLEDDERRIYIAGDTDVTPEAAAVRCDVALVPVGGTYTMNAQEAAALISEIQPQAAIPIHYGCIVGEREDGEAFRKLVSTRAPEVMVELRTERFT